MKMSHAARLAVAAALVACGGGQNAPKAAPAPSTSARPLEAWETDAGDAGADGAARKATEAPAKKSGASRPRGSTQPTITGSGAIETDVGPAGAVLVLGHAATLRIPEGAIPDGATVHFALAQDSAPHGPGRVGPVYELAPSLKSAAGPFVLEIPAAPSLSKPSCAISRTVKHGDDESLQWDVVTAHTDASKKIVVVELPELPGGWAHLTSKVPKGKSGK